jgi:ATP-binding cassette subfamily F protein uup
VGRIFAFESDGLQQYEGGYTEYYWKHQERYGAFLSLEEEQAKRAEAASVQKPSDSELEKKEAVRDAWKQHSSKLKFTYKEQQEYETIDDDIAKLEEQIEQLETEIQISATDFVALAKYTAQKEELEQALDEKMERWVYLNDLAEQIEADKK